MAAPCLCVAALGLDACSSDETGGSSGNTGDAAAPVDSGPGKDGGASDAAPVEVNACKSFVDQTAAGATRTITWTFDVATAPERCMKIKKGQTVTWNGDFTAHPLTPSGGDKPNPITNTATTTFTTAGTFGFVCDLHPAMIGAIQVVE